MSMDNLTLVIESPTEDGSGTEYRVGPCQMPLVEFMSDEPVAVFVDGEERFFPHIVDATDVVRIFGSVKVYKTLHGATGHALRLEGAVDGVLVEETLTQHGIQYLKLDHPFQLFVRQANALHAAG